MKENGKKINNMDLVKKSGQMEQCMKATTLKEKSMAKDY